MKMEWTNAQYHGEFEHPDFGLAKVYMNGGTDAYTRPYYDIEERVIFVDKVCLDSMIWVEGIEIGEFKEGYNAVNMIDFSLDRVQGSYFEKIVGI